MKIEIHQNGKPMQLSSHRATDSPTMWIDLRDDEGNELTLFVTPEQARDLGQTLTIHAHQAFRIREVLTSVEEK